jgi:hypothetical protein
MKTSDANFSPESSCVYFCKKIDSHAAALAEAIDALCCHLLRIAPDVRRALTGPLAPPEAITELAIRRVDSVRCGETSPPSLESDFRQALAARDEERGAQLERRGKRRRRR